MVAVDYEARFHWADYLVFVLTLLISSSTGVYYGIKDRGRKRNTLDNYLLGGRSMNLIPVSVSLFVSWLSAISFLGDPVEVYYHGALYWVIGIGYCLAVPPAACYFAPIFHGMQLYSIYEYMSTRYNWPIRLLGAIAMGIVGGLYSGIVLYGPALALAQASGISVWVSIVSVGLVCTFYTTLGGIKAVLWADTLQTVIMFIGLIMIVVRGCIVLGGLGEIWRIAESSGRINFNRSSFNPNPFVRSTFWTYLLGGFNRVFNPYISSQTFVQRYLSVKTAKQSSMVVYLNIPLYAIFVSMFALLGLVMVAYFDGCDPLASGRIEKVDQMVPLLMLELLGFLPGFPGLFLASLFCASLSTMSSVQSSLALSMLKDITEPLYERVNKKPMCPTLAIRLSKIYCVLLGFSFIGLSLIIMTLQDASIFQLTIQLTGCLLGPIAGIFFVGLLFPFVDSTGAVVGCVISLCISVWWNVGSIVTDLGPAVKLPVSTHRCSFLNSSLIAGNMSSIDGMWTVASSTATTTLEQTQFDSVSVLHTLYRFSPMIYSTFGFLLTAIISVTMGLVSKFIIKRSNQHFDVVEAEMSDLK